LRAPLEAVLHGAVVDHLARRGFHVPVADPLRQRHAEFQFELANARLWYPEEGSTS
jgi:hypothetical protein